MQNHNEKFKSDLKTRCYKLSLGIIKFVDLLPNKRACWIIADQLLRSTMSIGANLYEATSASSKLEFKKYHEIALKSANESKYWLSLLIDSGLIDKTKAENLFQEISEIANMLAAGIMKMKGKTSF